MSEDEQNEPASGACARDALDPGYAEPGPGALWAEVALWRKETRARLIAERLAIAQETRAAHARAIAERLEAELGDVQGRTVSFYWPFRGEPDLRALMEALLARGATPALPIVVAKGAPLTFKPWAPGVAMTRGVWNIPIPAEGAEVAPDVAIAPVVGFDAACFRLGYGGGFFDRTLEKLGPGASAIGVGYACAALPTIHPQPHDIAMAAIVTEEGVVRAR